MTCLLLGSLLLTPAESSEPSLASLLENQVAWSLLPGAPSEPRPLPAWARMLVAPMPRATASMLQLDGLMRTTPSLSPRLRALIRLAVAEANHCEYGQAIAKRDLKEYTGTDRLDPAGFSRDEKLVWDFCRQLALEASQTTDQQMRDLLDIYSEPQVVAMVLLVAHGSFQDRVFLTLQPPIEKEGVPGPLLVQFKLDPPPSAKPAGPKPTSANAAKPASSSPSQDKKFENLGPNDSVWTSKNLDILVAGKEQQKVRTPRIRIPDWKEVEARQTADSVVRRWPRVAWGLVAFNGQPELANAWFQCVDQYRMDVQPPPSSKETKFPTAGPATPSLEKTKPFPKPDRMIQSDMFWVVTRTLDCFY